MDAAVCAKVLQLVNSAYFGLGQKIVSVRAAVTYLGVEVIKSLVLGSSSFSDKAISEVKGFSPERLQHHSMLTALLAKKIVSSPQLADAAFTAGLLHDIGALVLLHAAPPDYVRALDRTKELGGDTASAEREIFGVTHAEVGAYLLGLWGIPFPIVEAVAFHHRPNEVAPESRALVAAIHIASGLVEEMTDAGGKARADGPASTARRASTWPSCAKPAWKRPSRRAAPTPKRCSARSPTPPDGAPREGPHDTAAHCPNIALFPRGRSAMRFARMAASWNFPGGGRGRRAAAADERGRGAGSTRTARAETLVQRFLASLPAELRSCASFSFDSPQRLEWYFVPRERVGVPLLKLDDTQSELLGPLLATALSPEGLLEARGVMKNENILRRDRDRGRHRRDASRSRPLLHQRVRHAAAAARPGRWRFEGHHLSLNVTQLPGQPPVVAPLFIGANPAQVP